MGRPPCCDKVGIKKGPWTPEEDIILVSYIQEHGPGNWRAVPTSTGLMRCSKSCRLRWTNYLRPGIKRGNFTPHEEGIIIHLQSLLGNRWAAIASYLPQRTDNDIKNYWNTHLKKRIKKFQEATTTTTSTTASPLLVRRDYCSEGCGVVEAIRKEDMEITRFPLPILHQHPSPPATLNYACSTENISRLLQGWITSSSPKNNNNNNHSNNDDDDDDDGNKKPEKSRGEAHSMLSFENMSGTSPAIEASFDAPKADAEAEAKAKQWKENSSSNNDDEEDDSEPPPPPLFFFEKWLFDEEAAAGPVEGLMELPVDCCSNSMF